MYLCKLRICYNSFREVKTIPNKTDFCEQEKYVYLLLLGWHEQSSPLQPSKLHSFTAVAMVRGSKNDLSESGLLMRDCLFNFLQEIG